MKSLMDTEKDFDLLKTLKGRLISPECARGLAGLLAGFGATAAVIALMKNPLGATKGLSKLLMKLGIFVLACKAGDMADDYLKTMIKEIEDAFKEGRQMVKEVSADV